MAKQQHLRHPTSNVGWLMCSWQSFLLGLDVKDKRNQAMEE